jgi:hypothetical protein
MRNTADVTSGKAISGVNVFNPLAAFYDIHGKKREALFFCFVPDATRDEMRNMKEIKHLHQ